MDAELEACLRKRVSTDEVRVRFSPAVGFYPLLKARVDAYFAEKGRLKTGDWRLFLKTGVILTCLITSYVVLVFFADSWPLALVSGFVLSQSLALVGMNIMHDGNHGSYSRSKRVNSFMGFTMDLIGANRVLWRQKHNILHHTYTNLESLDDDLDTAGLLRLSPEQPWRPWHRFQHWYALPVYSMLTLFWMSFADFRKWFSGRIGSYRLAKPSRRDSILFFATKALHFSLALGLPLWLHPTVNVLVAFLAIHMLLGVTLAVVFQLAHTVEGATFPTPDRQTSKVENAWAVHEVETTADFARGNRLVTWYLGGLNFQIEHHLFPRISHVHYPAISEIVHRTCQECGVRFLAFPTLRSAIRAHFRHLRRIGRRPEAGLEFSGLDGLSVHRSGFSS